MQPTDLIERRRAVLPAMAPLAASRWGRSSRPRAPSARASRRRSLGSRASMSSSSAAAPGRSPGPDRARHPARPAHRASSSTARSTPTSRSGLPGCTVIQGDATRLDEILARHGSARSAPYISGLPMVGMPDRVPAGDHRPGLQGRCRPAASCCSTATRPIAPVPAGEARRQGQARALRPAGTSRRPPSGSTPRTRPEVAPSSACGASSRPDTRRQLAMHRDDARPGRGHPGGDCCEHGAERSTGAASGLTAGQADAGCAAVAEPSSTRSPSSCCTTPPTGRATSAMREKDLGIWHSHRPGPPTATRCA